MSDRPHYPAGPPPTAAAPSSSSLLLLQLDDESSWLEVAPGDLGRKLRDLDFHLRCGICGEIVHHPSLLRPCGHTFCSECIRSHLQTQKNNLLLRDGCKCPKCKSVVDFRNQDFDQCLQRNREMEAVADAFRSLRAPLRTALSSVGGGGRGGHRRASAGEEDGERDEVRGDYDRHGGSSSAEEATAASAPRSTKKPLARLKLPVRFRSLKGRELRDLCKKNELVETGTDVEMRNRLERFCALWNARCGRGDETEKTIREEFAQRERAQARAAREDARSGAHGHGEHVKRMFEHRNGASLSTSLAVGHSGAAVGSSFSSGNAEFDEKWESSFRALIAKGRQQVMKSKQKSAQPPESSGDNPGRGSHAEQDAAEEEPLESAEPIAGPCLAASSEEVESPPIYLLDAAPESTQAESTEATAQAADATASDTSAGASPRKRKGPSQRDPPVDDRISDYICLGDSDPVSAGSSSLPSWSSAPSVPKRRRTRRGQGDVHSKNRRDSCSSSGSHQPWRCPRCTMVNADGRRLRCEACDLVYLSHEYEEWMTVAVKDGRFDDLAAAHSSKPCK